MKFKNGKIEPLDVYLGAKLMKKTMDGIERWTISSDKYVEAVVQNVEKLVKDKPKYKWERNK